MRLETLWGNPWISKEQGIIETAFVRGPEPPPSPATLARRVLARNLSIQQTQGNKENEIPRPPARKRLKTGLSPKYDARTQKKQDQGTWSSVFVYQK